LGWRPSLTPDSVAAQDYEIKEAIRSSLAALIFGRRIGNRSGSPESEEPSLMAHDSPPRVLPHPGLRWLLVFIGIVLSSGILLTAFFGTPWDQRQIDSLDLNSSIPEARPVKVDFSGYLGERSCAQCHPGESAAYATSGHGHTLWPAGEGPVARMLDGKRYADPELSGIDWMYHLRAKLLEVERIEQGKPERLTLEFGLGSGTHGVTFITTAHGPDVLADPPGVEHRLSYIVPTDKMEITPGQEKTDPKRLNTGAGFFGRGMTSYQVLECLACHTTLTSRTKANHVDAATLVANVSCERCHGPGRDHVEAVRNGKSDDLKMPMIDLIDPHSQVQLCGECHRLPSKQDPSSLRRGNPGIVRFQSVGLSLSPCFQNGMGTLKCTSCHEAHARTSHDQASYDAVCLQCHQPAGARRACPVSPREDCVRCHMPRRAAIGGEVFTNHWIGTTAAEDRDTAGHRQKQDARPGETH
jgi:Cytochrome c554 and c-prime